MPADVSALPVRLRGSRRKWVLTLFGCVAFAAAGLHISSEHAVVGYGFVVFFGLATLIACTNLLPNSSYLVLDTTGFTYASLFRERFVPWSHVQAFMPIYMHRVPMVGWKFVPKYPAAQILREISTSMSGVEGLLPDTYGKSASELAQLMESLRLRHGQTAL